MPVPIYFAAEDVDALVVGIRGATSREAADVLADFGLALSPLDSDGALRRNPSVLVLSEALGEFEAAAREANAEIARDGVIATVEADEDLIESYRALLDSDFAGVDLRVVATAEPETRGVWYPASPASFSNRGRAHRAIAAAALPADAGTGANVFVIDQGLDAAEVNRIGRSFGAQEPSFAGRLMMPPFAPPRFDPVVSLRRQHGHMIVRNILALAPNARIWDVPAIPPRINNVNGFVSQLTFLAMALRIVARTFRPLLGEFAACNAWAIFNREREFPLGNYTTRPNHPFNLQVARMVQDRIDCIFGAGNSGQFFPDRRSGPTDRGPHRSIWGANALDAVICAAAVRADDIWVGASSQGPGPAALGTEKPDLCAPSWFRETRDPALLHTGTSSACGIVAGAVAAIRSDWPTAVVSPADLRKHLRTSARPLKQSRWNGRTGTGVLDLSGLLKTIAAEKAGEAA